MALLQRSGRVSFLRVHDVGTAFGPADDQIDVEAVIRLTSAPDEAYGFQLRDDNNRVARKGMLDLLRDAFQNDHQATVDYNIDQDKKHGVIIRVALSR